MDNFSGTGTPASASRARERAGPYGGQALLAGEAYGVPGAIGEQAGSNQLLNTVEASVVRSMLSADACRTPAARGRRVSIGLGGVPAPSVLPMLIVTPW